MPGALADLGVAAQLWLRATSRRLRGQLEPEPDLDSFRDAMQGILEQLPTGIVKEARWLDIDASQPPWQDSGLQLRAGDEITYFACGRSYAAKALDVWFEPALQIWSRVGDSDVISATRNSHSCAGTGAGYGCRFLSVHSGELH